MSEWWSLKIHTGLLDDDDIVGYNDFTIYRNGEPFFMERDRIEITAGELKQLVETLSKMQLKGF